MTMPTNYPPPQGPPSGPDAPISPVPQRDVEPRMPQFRPFDLPVTTCEYLPGLEAMEVLGLVFGVVSRPRDLAHSPEMAYLNTTVRQDAVAAMVEQAHQIGAEAVLGVRFDGGTVSDSVGEITAFGTAVRRRLSRS